MNAWMGEVEVVELNKISSGADAVPGVPAPM